MNALWDNIKREPVRWFTGLSQLVPLIVSGLLVFDAWDPTAEQLAFVTGAPAALALIFGVTVVRNAVTPNEKLPGPVVKRAARDRGAFDAGGSVAGILIVVAIVLAVLYILDHV